MPDSVFDDELGPDAQRPHCAHEVPAELHPRNVRRYVGDDDGAVAERTLRTIMDRQSVMAFWVAGEMAARREEAELGRPVLTMGQAAGLVGLSRKRLEDIVRDETRKNGRPPAFVVDGGGRTRRRVARDELIDWMKARRPRRGRPSKSDRK